MTARDPQGQRVYNWEGRWKDWNRSTLTMEEMTDVVRWACRQYGMVAPRVKGHRGKDYSFSQGDLVSFNFADRNPAIALHESAHYITDAIFPNERLAHHSPQWAGIYLWLLENYGVAPRIALHTSAKAAGIRWVVTWVVSPKRLRPRSLA